MHPAPVVIYWGTPLLRRPTVKLPPSPFVRLGISCAAIALASGLLAPAASPACNVPVFRYALERWRPDPYRVTLFKRGNLTEAQQQLLAKLDDLSGVTPANVAVRIVELDVKNEVAIDDETDRKLLAASGSSEFPRLVVQYPESLRNDKPIATGPLTDETVSRTLVSPVRTELVRRLAAGQTAVWLLLECGDAAKDEAAAKQLTDDLKTLSKSLELPELSDAPEDNLLSGAPLGITFSLLRISRTAAVERSLVDALLASESDLLELNDPMIFPVFGRGRALLPLVGAGITTDNIRDSAQFLVGACSCEVKDLNPGFDLLLAADWEELLFQDPEKAAAAQIVAAKTAAPTGKPELVAIPIGAAALPAVTTKKKSAAEPRDNKPSESHPKVKFIAAREAFKRSLVGGIGLLAVVLVLIALKRRA
jgi:hypothetical protein